jgi:hypothetical protein
MSEMKSSETNRLWEKFSYGFQDAALFDFITVIRAELELPVLVEIKKQN